MSDQMNNTRYNKSIWGKLYYIVIGFKLPQSIMDLRNFYQRYFRIGEIGRDYHLFRFGLSLEWDASALLEYRCRHGTLNELVLLRKNLESFMFLMAKTRTENSLRCLPSKRYDYRYLDSYHDELRVLCWINDVATQIEKVKMTKEEK